MNKLTPDQLNRIAELLLTCDLFSSERQLRTLFTDPRIQPWQRKIPSQTENFDALVKQTVAFLIVKYNKDYENILVLFLEVLTDQTDKNDYSHSQIINLITELKPILNSKPTLSPMLSPIPPPINSRDMLYTFLKNHFNKSEIKELCFRLKVDYEDLLGSTKKDKARELVLFMERRNKLEELTSIIQQIRPDITISYGKNDSNHKTPVQSQIQKIEAVANLLRLTLEGTSDKWTLRVANESDGEVSKINIILRPAPTVAVSPNKIQLGVIQSGQTKQAITPVIIRPNQTTMEDICILPFEVVYATPKIKPKRYQSEFHIPILTTLAS